MNYKLIFLIITLSSNLFAYSLEELWFFYQNGQYEKVCSKQVASNDYYEYNDDENFINMYAHSCLETDMINKLAIPIIQLRKTKDSRANATYYATILYQKKLLYQALIDEDISLPKDLPQTHYILSKIYHNYVHGNYKKKDNIYIFQDDTDKNTTYRLFKTDDNGFKKIILETIQNGILIKTRAYW